MHIVKRILRRRAELKTQFDVRKQWETIEESCVPSYVHQNPLAAWVAWARLTAAVSLHSRHAPPGEVLDFGAATGELHHVLAPKDEYHFVEENQALVDALSARIPSAKHVRLEDLPERTYAAIFALDSLEHNEDVRPLLEALADSLRPDGIFILSGPTENWLYKLGRKIARFDGHYHQQTIYDIEQEASRSFQRVERRVVPLGVPLFSISAWRLRTP
jgi:2-polyprenyl-3-methyl-5-hydroxy-6-metoxy-1,4-benzoquinol methylase